ncbi:hypothetical protein Mapa_013114 [Marchantia paleacea]|nr:hypothetical protein Mapa_013114 [Marchantia paleacea]
MTFEGDESVVLPDLKHSMRRQKFHLVARWKRNFGFSRSGNLWRNQRNVVARILQHDLACCHTPKEALYFAIWMFYGHSRGITSCLTVPHPVNNLHLNGSSRLI